MSGETAPSHGIRRLAAAMLPPATRAAIDRARSRRLLRLITPLNDEYVRRYGLEVRHGPFAGMMYTADQQRSSGDLIAKLIGTYECQIYPWFSDWIAGAFDLIIDVGCAEGFYAVGLARAMPGTEVRAYDIDASSRRKCEELARLNGVHDRVLVAGECTPPTLAEVSEARVALLSDCEGYEKILLDPQAAPNLRSWSIIVELHDINDPTISATIADRFHSTHHIETVHYVPPERQGLVELSWMNERQAQLVLNERPLPMSWAYLTPR
jgi:hypothetical protein